MTSRFLSVLATATLVAAGAGWSAASDSHSVGVTLSEATTVNGTVLPAGRYRFSWMGSGNEVNVTIEGRDSGNVLTKTEAKVETTPQRAPDTEVVTRTAKSGSQVLEQLRLRDKTMLVFAPAS